MGDVAVGLQLEVFGNEERIIIGDWLGLGQFRSAVGAGEAGLGGGTALA